MSPHSWLLSQRKGWTLWGWQWWQVRATVEAPCDGRDRGKESLVSLNLLALTLRPLPVAAGESLPHGGADGQEDCQGRQVNLETQDIFSCLKIL